MPNEIKNSVKNSDHSKDSVKKLKADRLNLLILANLNINYDNIFVEPMAKNS